MVTTAMKAVWVNNQDFDGAAGDTRVSRGLKDTTVFGDAGRGLVGDSEARAPLVTGPTTERHKRQHASSFV